MVWLHHSMTLAQGAVLCPCASHLSTDTASCAALMGVHATSSCVQNVHVACFMCTAGPCTTTCPASMLQIADFGVARIIETTGHMTAETGTYRWMAPEVIEHKPYDEKADVFSFAVVLWELLTCKVPYSDMTPLQAAVGVVQKGLRPGIPAGCPPTLGDLMTQAWAQAPTARPSFRELTPRLAAMMEAAKEEEARQLAAAAAAAQKAGASGGLFSKLRGK